MAEILEAIFDADEETVGQLKKLIKSNSSLMD